MTATDATRVVDDLAQRQTESRARLAEIKAQVEREFWSQQAEARQAPVYQPMPPAPAPVPQWTPVYEQFRQVVYTPLPAAPRRQRSMLGGLRCGWLLVKLLVGFSLLYVMAMAAFVQAVTR